jgi:hypothetical protein
MIISQKELHDIFNALIGTWNLSRHIQDFKNNKRFSVAGEATWTVQSDQSSLYQEEGTLSEGVNFISTVFRRYQYALNEEGLIISYDEKDMRSGVLHELQFQKMGEKLFRANHRHSCSPDLYDLTATLDLEKRHIHFLYKISGPNKNMKIETHLTPA